MDEIIKRHASEFDEAFEIVQSIDLTKDTTTYRIEILRKIETGYRTRFTARYFKKGLLARPVSDSSTGTPDLGSVNYHSDEVGYWIALQGVPPTSDTPRDALNQALIWLGIYVKKHTAS